MAGYACAIEKQVSFQGRTERFSNVYTFDTGTVENFDDNQVITSLVALERAVFTQTAQFVKASTYGIYGLDITNVMREVRDLTGTGDRSSNPMYFEQAFLIQWELPRSQLLKRKRVGRKWLHTCGWPIFADNVQITDSDMIRGRAALPSSYTNNFLTNYANPLMDDTRFGGASFASHGDKFRNPKVFPYIEHRQFKRGRKRKR